MTLPSLFGWNSFQFQFNWYLDKSVRKQTKQTILPSSISRLVDVDLKFHPWCHSILAGEDLEIKIEIEFEIENKYVKLGHDLSTVLF